MPTPMVIYQGRRRNSEGGEPRSPVVGENSRRRLAMATLTRKYVDGSTLTVVVGVDSQRRPAVATPTATDSQRSTVVLW
jgi:hypothetical protein